MKITKLTPLTYFLIAFIVGFMIFLILFFSNTEPKKPYIKINSVPIELIVAASDEQKRIGLSNTTNLKYKTGMLFDFSNTENMRPAFWMKDMKIPIDIIWIKNSKIISINKNVQPEPNKSDKELTIYYPPQSVDYVLEINANESEKHNFSISDEVKLVF